MFSGIIQSKGKVTKFDGNFLKIEAPEIAKENNISESISVNGACLTIVDKDLKSFSVNVVEETIDRTSLGQLSIGSNVNLEPALKVGDKIGGHNVQGHVDCTTDVKKITQIDNSWVVDFNKPSKFSHYFIEKGFIAIDGVSLTITNDIDEFFSIAVIPFTWNHTIFSGYEVGSVVNLEVDMTAKYIEKIIKNSHRLEKAN
ncbi:MAG: riboflavin synthase [Dehalococcoidia bacterium]